MRSNNSTKITNNEINTEAEFSRIVEEYHLLADAEYGIDHGFGAADPEDDAADSFGLDGFHVTNVPQYRFAEEGEGYTAIHIPGSGKALVAEIGVEFGRALAYDGRKVAEAQIAAAGTVTEYSSARPQDPEFAFVVETLVSKLDATPAHQAVEVAEAMITGLTAKAMSRYLADSAVRDAIVYTVARGVEALDAYDRVAAVEGIRAIIPANAEVYRTDGSVLKVLPLDRLHRELAVVRRQARYAHSDKARADVVEGLATLDAASVAVAVKGAIAWVVAEDLTSWFTSGDYSAQVMAQLRRGLPAIKVSERIALLAEITEILPQVDARGRKVVLARFVASEAKKLAELAERRKAEAAEAAKARHNAKNRARKGNGKANGARKGGKPQAKTSTQADAPKADAKAPKANNRRRRGNRRPANKPQTPQV